MVLYRKYRPQTLNEVIGQDHVKEPLLAQLQSGKVTHAYLFSGPRGTGKTSVARILAKAVNCMAYSLSTTDYSKEKDISSLKALDREPTFGEPCGTCESCRSVIAGNHLDLIEIDAASNRGIDEIRELRERIKLSTAGGRYKVFIIDEAHMLTPEAFNALLKTLEEPPAHVIFILATTEPQKIPATITSRATRFDFKVPTVAQIKEKLSLIVKKEGWGLEENVLAEIAKLAAGAFRDAEVLLEKIASVDPAASKEKVGEVLGKKETTDIINLLFLIENSQLKDALIWLDNYVKEGGSVRILAENILEALRKILLIKAGAVSVIGPATSEENIALQNLAATTQKLRLIKLTDLFNKAIDGLRDASIPQLPLELAIIEATFDNSEIAEIQTKYAVSVPTSVKTTQTNESSKAETSQTAAIKDRQPAETAKEEEESEKPVRKPVNEDKILAGIKKNWGKFLKELKPLNSSLELFLRGAKPIDLDDDLLTIEFGYRFHKQKVEEKKYREIVETLLSKIAGQALRIKGAVGKSVLGSTQPKKEARMETASLGSVDPVEVFGKLD